MSSKVLLTTKFIPIVPATKTTAASPCYSSSESCHFDLQSVTSTTTNESAKRKRRLDHLTWEEKIQRKKLKNRVAAQTSRDRKKAKVEEMEITINALNERTETLQNKCNDLQALNDSLLDKNGKLELQVQILEKQLTQFQHQQNVVNCGNLDLIGSNSITSNRSAEGKDGIEVNSMQETTTNNKYQRQFSGFTMEDNNTLPSLQDLFEDFDATKLEELAESLLAGIQNDLESSNLEGSNSESRIVDAEIESKTEQLLGRLVGTTTELMESSSNANDTQITQNLCINQKEQISNDHDYNMKDETNVKEQSNIKNQKCKSKNQLYDNKNISETIYGKYDEQTNSITILMDDDVDSTEEIIEEEIICETTETNDDEIYRNDDKICKNKIETEICNNNDEIDYDPIKEFLCIPSKNEYARIKSPYTLSDCGYSSIGSPQIDSDDPMRYNSILDESFSELFPNLI